MRSDGSSPHCVLPAERFYWSRLDLSMLPRGARATHERLDYLFETRLPVAVDSLCTVYVPMPDHPLEIIACGLDRELVAEARDDGALTLTPDRIPDFLDDPDRSPDAHVQSVSQSVSRFNLLTGSWTPPVVERIRRRSMIAAALLLALVTALIVTGLERRTASTRDAIVRVEDATMGVYEDVLGPVARTAIGTSYPPERRLTAERRALEQTRAPGAAGLTDQPDAARLLAELLHRWPDQPHAETESVAIAGSLITIRTRLASMSDVDPFAATFDTWTGWRRDQSQSSVQRDHVDVTMRLERTGEASTP